MPHCFCSSALQFYIVTFTWGFPQQPLCPTGLQANPQEHLEVKLKGILGVVVCKWKGFLSLLSFSKSSFKPATTKVPLGQHFLHTHYMLKTLNFNASGVSWSFPQISYFAPKENRTCLIYMSTAGLKERGCCSPVTLNHMKMLQGKRKKKATVATWVSLLVFVCRRLQCWAQAISGLCGLTHMLMIRASTHGRSFSDSLSIAAPLIRQLDGRQYSAT